MWLASLPGEDTEKPMVFYRNVPMLVVMEWMKLKQKGIPQDMAFKQAAQTIRELYPGKTKEELIELSRELYRQGKL